MRFNKYKNILYHIWVNNVCKIISNRISSYWRPL